MENIKCRFSIKQQISYLTTNERETHLIRGKGQKGAK